jgi:transposase
VEEAGNETETEDTKNSTRARVEDRRDRRVEKSVSPKGKLGRPTASIELVLEGILYVLSEGCSWRAIDRKELSWNTVYKYFRKWCRRNAFERLLNEFGPELEPGWHFVDSTHVKVHADGSNPAGGQAHQAVGRTKGGLNTKIHAVVNSQSNAIVIALSAGNEADISYAEALVEDLPQGSVIVADKAYDSTAFRETVARKGSRTCIPSRSNRLAAPSYSKAIYRRRHRVENFFQKIKRFRRVATRYDKLAESFLGFVCLSIFVIQITR